jgi:uncharacterized membrane protein
MFKINTPMHEKCIIELKKLFHLLKYNNNNNNFAFSSHQFEGGLWGGGGIFNSDANEIFKWLKKVRPSIAL